MLIPLGVDVPMERRPFVNWLMVAGMCGIFAWQLTQPTETIESLCLNGFFSKGLFTHMWIHGDIFHLTGNMIFLWVFGNAICYKTGNLLYLPIFFVLGLASALTYSFYCSNLMLGASGAINGIVGMFLVLFPINDITCLFGFFPYYRKFSVSSYWMILYWLAFDILGAILGGGMVAYWAHIGGFAGGFGLAWLLVHVGFIKMTRFENSLLDLIHKQKHPEEYKSTTEKYADYMKAQAEAEDQKYIEQAKQPEPSPEPQPQPLYPITPAETKKPTPAKTSAGFIKFKCACGKQIKTSSKNAGKKGKCPKCKNPITVPPK